MIIKDEGLNPDLMGAFKASHEGYRTLCAGNIALLGASSRNTIPRIFEGSVADLLLASPSTAIMHHEEPKEDGMSWGTMLAVNYHNGHSEGHHKIVVQDPSRVAEGQWELWIPPGSLNRTFYRRVLLRGTPYRFEKSPTNPGKIRHYYVHVGDSADAISDFQSAGFEFSDEFPGEPYTDTDSPYDRLGDLSLAYEGRWDPFAEK